MCVHALTIELEENEMNETIKIEVEIAFSEENSQEDEELKEQEEEFTFGEEENHNSDETRLEKGEETDKDFRNDERHLFRKKKKVQERKMMLRIMKNICLGSKVEKQRF